MSTLGNSAPSSHTWNLDALMTTTLLNYRAKLVDNIFKANSFLAALRQYGGVEYKSGGVEIQQELMYEEDTSQSSYEGYEQINIVPQDGITAASFRWAEIAGAITISRREERANSGEAQILDLLQAKIKKAEMTLKSKVNSQLLAGTVSSATFVPGNSAKDMYPLGYFFRKLNATDPIAGGNVGGISAATYDWWRCRTADIGSNGTQTGNSFAIDVTTLAGLPIALRRMQNFCARGADGSAPNLMVGDQVSYETYNNALDAKMRYSDSAMAEMGFENVKCGGATMIWDELVPDIYTGTAAITKGTFFHLNTNFYKLTIDKETDFITTPFTSPENQTAKSALVLFMGNATISNPRKCGVSYDILQTIVA